MLIDEFREAFLFYWSIFPLVCDMISWSVTWSISNSFKGCPFYLMIKLCTANRESTQNQGQSGDCNMGYAKTSPNSDFMKCNQCFLLPEKLWLLGLFPLLFLRRAQSCIRSSNYNKYPDFLTTFHSEKVADKQRMRGLLCSSSNSVASDTADILEEKNASINLLN